METATSIRLNAAMRAHAMRTFRLTSDFRLDPWGGTMGHLFAISEVLYHSGRYTPQAWGFRHGVLAHESWLEDGDAERDYYAYLDAGELGVAMLLFAGNVLNRYAVLLEANGRNR